MWKNIDKPPASWKNLINPRYVDPNIFPSFGSLIWTCPDGARLLRLVASRCRAPYIMFHKNKIDSIIRARGTILYSLLCFNSRLDFNGLKYLYSVIKDSLPGNTNSGEITPFVDDQSVISRNSGQQARAVYRSAGICPVVPCTVSATSRYSGPRFYVL